MTAAMLWIGRMSDYNGQGGWYLLGSLLLEQIPEEFSSHACDYSL